MNAPGVTKDLFKCARVACGGSVIERPIGAAMTTTPDEEPRPPEVRDYVLQPGAHQPDRWKSGPSTTAWVASKLGLARETPLEQSQDPYVLLQNQVPVRVMVTRNKVGLQHFCKAGVSMNDFLQCGYTLRDLCEFKDVSGARGKHRALQALAIGLRADANLFRDYPDAFPIEGVRKLTGMENDDICKYFGLSFPHALAPLQCSQDEGWRASDVIKLGLSIGNLCDFGMETTAQYDALMEGLSEASRADMDRKLGVTAKHRAEWSKIDAAILEQQRVQQQEMYPAAAPVINVSPYYAETVREDEPMVHAPMTLPTPAPAVAAINHVPPRVGGRNAAVAATTAVAAPLGFEQRAAQRARLHGFLG